MSYKCSKFPCCLNIENEFLGVFICKHRMFGVGHFLTYKTAGSIEYSTVQYRRAGTTVTLAPHLFPIFLAGSITHLTLYKSRTVT
jgi:hypothetical protein